jgi:hypothetical protein
MALFGFCAGSEDEVSTPTWRLLGLVGGVSAAPPPNPVRVGGLSWREEMAVFLGKYADSPWRRDTFFCPLLGDEIHFAVHFRED